MRLHRLLADTQNPDPGETLNLWLDVTTAPTPIETYEITGYLVNSVTYERVALQKSIPYDHLYPSLHWRGNDRLFIPLRLLLPADIAEGSYHLGITFYDIEEQRAIPLEPQTTQEATLHAGWIRIGSPRIPSVEISMEHDNGAYAWEDLILLFQPQVGISDSGNGTPHELLLELPWQAIRPISRNLTFFVHLIDGNDIIVAQLDRLPFEGRFPTPVWRAHERMEDLYRLPLPETLPAGPYRLRVGFYDGEGALRLSAPVEAKNAEYVILDLPVVISR